MTLSIAVLLPSSVWSKGPVEDQTMPANLGGRETQEIATREFAESVPQDKRVLRLLLTTDPVTPVTPFVAQTHSDLQASAVSVVA